MKAITIRQPWAGLIACGLKTIETRNWKTKHRGSLAIHAGKTVDANAYHLLGTFPAWHGKENLVTREPLGVIIAVCNLVDIKEYITLEQFLGDEKKHCIPRDWYTGPVGGWILKDIKPLKTPIPWRGMPGLFEVEL
jgi:hypothetical protein